MPRKRHLEPEEPSGADVLAGIEERYNREDLPSVVWTILRADAEAEVVTPEVEPGPWGNDDPRPYVMEPTFADLKVTLVELNKTRDFARQLYNRPITEPEGIVTARELLYERLGRDKPPVPSWLQDTDDTSYPAIDSTTAFDAAPSDGATRDTTTRLAHKRTTRVAGDATESDWKWNPNDQLGSAQTWGRSLMRCEHLNATPKLLGMAMRDVADTKTGTVYFGVGKAMEILGMKEERLKTHRSKLVKAGWLRDSGQRSKFDLTLWRLTIPRCCELPSMDYPDSIDDHD